MKYILRCLLAVTFFSFGLKVKAITNINVDNYSLVPYFSDYIMKYNVFVNNDTNNVNVTATLGEDDDYVTGTGNIELVDGINEVILKVIKKNNDILTYQVDIYRNYDEDSLNDNVNLKSLIINGYDINFDPNVYEYDVNVLDDVRLDIDYETMSDNASVRITGNSNLREGKNEVRLIVSNKDKSKVSVYILNVNKVVTTFNEEVSKIEKVENENILGKDHLTKKETNIVTLVVISICSILIMFIFYLLFIINRKH